MRLMQACSNNTTRKTATDDNVVKVLFRGHDGRQERATVRRVVGRDTICSTEKVLTRTRELCPEGLSKILAKVFGNVVGMWRYLLEQLPG